MTVSKIVRLPAHGRSAYEAISAPFDSCFVPRGFLFPESREDLAPYREFPLSEPFYISPQKPADQSVDDIFRVRTDESEDDSDSNCFDSTILHISELDELLLDVQAMGMQYTMHTQMGLRRDLTYDFPKTWDKTQALLTDIPVFSEELCQWHYPISTMGYNIANTDPPIDIDTSHNYPKLFGYLPNGDIAVYWEIAEILIREFGIEADTMLARVDGTLILMPGAAEQIKEMAPCDCVVDTGIAVDPGEDAEPAIAFARQWLQKEPIVLRHATYPFYRLILPVIHCELDFNPYAEATWGAFGYSSPRLSGYEFKIVNNPFTRDVPIFATERGNVVVSLKFYERLSALLRQFGMPFEAQLFPIQRIP